MANTIDVVVPAAGESVSEGVIARWIVQDGDAVEEGAPLFELETDKATLDVPAPASGRVTVGVQAGETVNVGAVVGSIAVGAAAGVADASTDAGKTGDAAEKPVADSTPPLSPELSPAVRRIVNEKNIDVEKIKGSGKDGRITTGDLVHADGAKQDTGSSKDAGGGAEASSASPAAKPASAAAKPAPTAAARTETAAVASGEAAPAQERQPLSRIRKIIAANLVNSKRDAAHLTTINEIDMTEVQALRALYKEEFEERHGIRLGFMSFFVTASCRALLQFPRVNAFLEADSIVYNNNCNIGVALAAAQGLIVPVIRSAQQKDFAAIEQEIKDFAVQARDKKLSPAALSGGTFTITNGGVFGSLLSTPIPNPPQTAILGMHSINKRPVAVGDEIAIRPIMYVALTYDHRLIDGKEAVGFLRTIKESIEQPARLMLNI